MNTLRMNFKKPTWKAEYSLYAIFGYPLSHTFSPRMQNEAFKALGLNSYYIDIPIPPERFKKLVRSLKNSPLNGFNLTVPHKEIILKALDSVDPEARRMGAVNTVLVKSNGKRKKLIGYNTDAYGFSKALKKEAGFNVGGKSVLILGAGGAARACVYALLKEGARRVVIANRTVSKAKRLIRDFSKIKTPGKTKLSAIGKTPPLSLPEFDLIINSTSLGLKGSDPLPINLTKSPNQKSVLIFDLIYNPSRTKLLREASKRGYRTMNGLAMLLYQGARSFEIWTGKRAPINIMRKTLKDVGAG